MLFLWNSGKIPERTLKRSQSVSWNSPREYAWDPPNPIIQGISRLQSISRMLSPPSTAGNASFFRSGSGEGLSESVMEFPAVLGVSLNYHSGPPVAPPLGPVVQPPSSNSAFVNMLGKPRTDLLSSLGAACSARKARKPSLAAPSRTDSLTLRCMTLGRNYRDPP